MEELLLQVRYSSGRVSTIQIDRFPFSIGRGDQNDLVLPDSSVSTNHAYLRLSGSGVAIVDNRSRVGVYVNQERVQRESKLRPGDVIEVGSVQIQLVALGRDDITVGEFPLDSSVQFVPSQKTWDSMESLASDAPPKETSFLEGLAELRSMIKLFLEAPLPQVYERILDLIEETVPFDRCFLILFQDGDPEKIQTVARRLNYRHATEVIVSKQILKRVAQSAEAVLVSSGDNSYSPTESFLRSGASTAICVPLIARGNVTGVIYLDRIVSDRTLSQKDIEDIGPLAGFVALKVENLRLMQSHIESQVLIRDLELAKTIQEGLLPSDPVSISGYAVEGYTSFCYQVGGDYFDFLKKDDQRLTIVLGDVSGKGLSSALYMVGIRSALHAHYEDGLELRELVCRLEKHATKAFRPEYFLTLVIGDLDLKSGVLTYCNAGHLPPMVVTSEGKVREFETTDPALNIAGCEQFHCRQCELELGDLLFLYTDGLIEAANRNEEFFGVKRLQQVLVENRDENLHSLRKRLLSAIEEFTDEDNPSDDRTLILVRREEERWDNGQTLTLELDGTVA